METRIGWALSAFFFATSGAGAQQATIAKVPDFPGAVDSPSFGINLAGTIVGDFRFETSGKVRGYALSQGSFTVIEFPESGWTSPRSINDAGDMAGFYYDGRQGNSHGFLLKNGVFTEIDFPGATQTQALGIDDDGDVVGGYCSGGDKCLNAGQPVHGFLLSGGVYTAIDVPGAIFTQLGGINRRQMVGQYAGPDGILHLFVLSGGQFSTIDYPGALQTELAEHGFAGSINESGQIVGDYCTAPCTDVSQSVHGFLLSGGSFVSFDAPASLGSAATAINSQGDVVGAFIGVDGHEHGFVRTLSR